MIRVVAILSFTKLEPVRLVITYAPMLREQFSAVEQNFPFPVDQFMGCKRSDRRPWDPNVGVHIPVDDRACVGAATSKSPTKMSAPTLG